MYVPAQASVRDGIKMLSRQGSLHFKVSCRALLRLTPIAEVRFEYIRLPLLSVFPDFVWKAMKTAAHVFHGSEFKPSICKNMAPSWQMPLCEHGCHIDRILVANTIHFFSGAPRSTDEIAVTFNDRDLGMIERPIQQRDDARRIGKDFAPFLEGRAGTRIRQLLGDLIRLR